MRVEIARKMVALDTGPYNASDSTMEARLRLRSNLVAWLEEHTEKGAQFIAKGTAGEPVIVFDDEKEAKAFMEHVNADGFDPGE